MKRAGLILFAFLLTGCKSIPPFEPPSPSSVVVVNVHWQDQGVAGIPIVLLQTRDSVCTGTNGLAIFAVPEGHYVVRAYGINRGGPVMRSIDFDVYAKPGETAVVDIVDCLPCV